MLYQHRVSIVNLDARQKHSGMTIKQLRFHKTFMNALGWALTMNSRLQGTFNRLLDRHCLACSPGRCKRGLIQLRTLDLIYADDDTVPTTSDYE